eukprot:GFUD01034658.1.p1 GENE.GFUD01034658.1~~GFUD01034658.1.p1  ORF type:complete len:620 (+),score=189.82 GFUD01034658.1:47-1906(+)
MKRASSLFSIFTAEEGVDNNLRSVQEEVVAVKQACKAACKAFKDCLQLKKMENLEAMGQESTYYKSGELMLRKAGMVNHSESPVREILTKTGEVFKIVGYQQANLESTIHQVLDEGKINELVTKDYLHAETEMSELKRKIGQHANSKNKYEREQKKLDTAKETDDPEYERELESRTGKAEAEMDALYAEVVAAEDKLAATLYSLQSNERLYAENILACMHQLKGCLTRITEQVDAALPAMQHVLDTTPRRKVFGEDLETHLQTRNVKIAVPLRFAVCGLLGHLREEGLFRVGPGLLSLRRAKTALDAGVPNKQLRAQFNNPHIFTAVIKAYLRELKDPLLCSKYSNLWVEADGVKERSKQVELIKELLAKLPEANRTNIGYLVQFLSKLVAEKDHNLMTTANLVIVIGPNLLWKKDSETEDAFSINSALKIMIDEVAQFFPTSLLTECDEDDPHIPCSQERVPKSPSSMLRSFWSWDNGSSQEKRRFSDDSLEMQGKGSAGVYNMFRSDTLRTEEEDDKNDTLDKSVYRERAQSTDKLKDIREETMVEQIVDNFETINPVGSIRKVSRDSAKSSPEEKSKKSHSRTHSGTSVKDFMSSVTSTIRRNKSSGYYEDRNKKK